MSTAACMRSNDVRHGQPNHYSEDDLYTYINEEYSDDEDAGKRVSNFAVSNDFDVLDLIESDPDDFERWMVEEENRKKQEQKKKKQVSKNMDKKTSKTSDRKKAKRSSAQPKRSKPKDAKQQQQKQRHSAKLPVKKARDDKKKRNSTKPVAKKQVRVSLPPKEHNKKEKLKLDRSKSTKVIQESKATKPSIKKEHKKRSKSRYLSSETDKASNSDKNQENINKTNKSKSSQKRPKLHSKSKSCREPLARSKSNRVNVTKSNTKNPKVQKKQKKQLSFREPPKEPRDEYIKGVSQKRVRIEPRSTDNSGSTSRTRRRATKKLIISKPVDEKEEEEDESSTEDEDSGSYDDDDEEEEVEEKKANRTESAPLIARVESSSNITPSLVAAVSTPSREEEMKTLYKEYDEAKRSQWGLGSELQVYSKSEKSWMKAKVIEVIQNGYYHDDGEWLKVLYHDTDDNELTKSLPRKDRHFKHSVPHFTHLKKSKTRKNVKRYMEKYANSKAKDRFKGFWVGQKCECWDKKNERKLWCQVVLLYEASNGTYVGVRYWNDEHMEYKEQLAKGFEWLRATIPPDLGKIMRQKWRYLSHRVKKLPGLLESRNVHLSSMADFYTRYEISDYKEIPDAVCMLIQSQNIKLFPILLVDIDNILIPKNFIEFMQREYDNSSASKMFKNLDDLCNPKKRKGKGKRKQYTYLRRKMYSVMRKLNALLDEFRGHVAVVYEGDFDDFVCDIPDSAGGVVWRRMFKRFISQRNQNDQFGFYSAKSVLQVEQEKNPDMNMDKARELAMIRFFRSKLMEMEYERLKDETYFIPVVLALSDPQKQEFHKSACNAAQEVFQTYYRVVCYQLDTEKMTEYVDQPGSSEANDTLRKLFHQNRHIDKTFVKCTKHPFMDVFIDSDADFYKLFEKHTWHKLFKDHGQDDDLMYATEYIKISP